MKALVGAFNQEKALVGAFFVIVQPVVEPMDSFTALIYTVHITAMTRHNSLGCCDDSIYDYDSIPSHYALILLVFMFINVLIVAINWLI